MSTTDLQLNIISAEKKIFSGKVTSVTLPGTLGGFSILPDHAPMVSSLKAGIISYTSQSETHEITIKGGFVEINHNVAIVCIE